MTCTQCKLYLIYETVSIRPVDLIYFLFIQKHILNRAENDFGDLCARQRYTNVVPPEVVLLNDLPLSPRKWTRYYSMRGNETAEIYNTLVKLIWGLFSVSESRTNQTSLNRIWNGLCMFHNFGSYKILDISFGGDLGSFVLICLFA